AQVRVELGTRTIFNLTGPMANPAFVKRQLMGVYDPVWLRPVAETLAKLGAESAWVVHGGGLDELVLDGENHVASLRQGEIREFTLCAVDAGLPTVPLAALQGGDAAENAAALLDVLQGARNGYRDTILFNAAAALMVAGAVGDLREGVARAAQALDSGAALRVLETLRAASQEVSLA
ncbi:MAG TPA: anthranilate phosphoribosyltransferase, partial [Acidocella sp.]|nr:anthranilate phosphoribosyltransferase [Acidocella sp.]